MLTWSAIKFVPCWRSLRYNLSVNHEIRSVLTEQWACVWMSTKNCQNSFTVGLVCVKIRSTLTQSVIKSFLGWLSLRNFVKNTKSSIKFSKNQLVTYLPWFNHTKYFVPCIPVYLVKFWKSNICNLQLCVWSQQSLEIFGNLQINRNFYAFLGVNSVYKSVRIRRSNIYLINS
jgi:hypothetical protein